MVGIAWNIIITFVIIVIMMIIVVINFVCTKDTERIRPTKFTLKQVFLYNLGSSSLWLGNLILLGWSGGWGGVCVCVCVCGGGGYRHPNLQISEKGLSYCEYSLVRQQHNKQVQIPQCHKSLFLKKSTTIYFLWEQICNINGYDPRPNAFINNSIWYRTVKHVQFMKKKSRVVVELFISCVHCLCYWTESFTLGPGWYCVTQIHSVRQTCQVPDLKEDVIV